MAAPPANRVSGSPLMAWALSALVLLVPLVYWEGQRDYTLPPKLLILQGILALTLTVWLASGDRTLRLPPFGLPALAYLLANTVSLLYAADPVVGLLELSKILSGFLLFLIVANRLQPHQIPRILSVWALAGIAVSLLGIVEYLGWRPINIPSAGLPSATLGYRNIAAMYMIQSIPFGLGLFAIARSRGIEILAGLAAALMLVFLVYTRTRGAWIGLAGGALITLVLLLATRKSLTLPHGPKRTIASAALVLALALAFLPSGLAKIGPQSIDEKKADVKTAVTSIFQEGGSRGRLTMWGHTLDMVWDHLLLGVGLGNWAVHYPRYDRGDWVNFNSAPERPHNDLLWILSEVGLIGFICYLWLGIAALQSALKCLRSSDGQTRWIAAACLTSLLAIVGHSLFTFPRERITPTVLFWLALGLLAVLDPSRSRVRGASARLLVGLSLLLVLLQLALTRRVVQFESRMYRAIRAEERNDWQRVASETAAAIQAGSFHPEAVHLRGYALNQTGDFTASRELYRSALRRRPYDIRMLNGVAIASQNLGLTGDALGYYTRALNVVPDLPDVHHNLGELYLQIGRIDSAVDAYRRAVELRPGEAQTLLVLGEHLNRKGHLREALDAYRAFLQYWKGDPRYAEVARSRIAELTSNRP